MWLDGLVELLSPARCAACDAPGLVLCADCRASLPTISRDAACSTCGAPVPDRLAGCRECVGRSFAFSACRSVGLFESPLSDVVKVYKDAGERRLVPVIAELMADTADDWLGWAEAIVPVPSRPSALRARGFDHMTLLAAALSKRCGVSMSRCLAAADARDQRGLGRGERASNTIDRFSFKGGPSPRRLLLVDDVFTTGATFESCAGVLIAAGASEVRVLSLARVTDAGG